MRTHPCGSLELRGEVRFALGAGVGVAEDYILAFDRALREAGFSDYNLLKVSSILPAGARLSEGVDLPKGSLLPIAFGEKASRRRGERVGAAVAVAIPEDPDAVGVIMEVTGNEDAGALRRRAEELARKAMEDRGLKVREVLSTGADAVVGEGYTCVFAGVALWRSQS